jgi:hypothetical protein
MRDAKYDAAKRLSDWHFSVEPGMRQIFYIDLPGNRIGLLEVNEHTPPTGSVEPFVFAPAEDIPYTTVIAEITPDEFERLRQDPRALPLPEGWNLSTASVFDAPRRAG